jgi:uncharacterized membrane protein YqaE (UPF0057 family)
MHVKKSLPVSLWITISGMGIFAIVHFISGLTHPIQFIAFSINILLIAGLYSTKKWAYVVTIVIALLIPFILVFNHSGMAFNIFLLNSVVLIPLLLSTKFFFSSSMKEISK